MTRQSPIDHYLLSLLPKDFRRDLEPMRQICAALQNPQLQYPTIHVAGTNGKGSTCAFLESLLRSQGLKTGLITSPHLIDLRERIQINRQRISVEHLEKVVETIRCVLASPDFLSFFEMMALAGFQFFAQEGVDVALVEVGLGGRLDATNVVQPAVGVLTPMALEHQEYLGNTLAKIAREKCGILKKGMHVVTGDQPPEVMNVIEEVCGTLELPLSFVPPLDGGGAEEGVTLGLAGDHQRLNAALALKAAELFLQREWASRKCLSASPLSTTHWPGRLQYLSRDPLVLVDGAHNPHGAQSLAAYLKKVHSDKEIILLFGCMKDKDVGEIAKILGPLVKRVVCVVPKSDRSKTAAELASIWNQYGFDASLGENVVHACQQIIPTLKPNQMLVATGSLFLVGEILSTLPSNT